MNRPISNLFFGMYRITPCRRLHPLVATHPRQKSVLNQNTYLDGGVYERTPSLVKRAVLLDRQSTGQNGKLKFLPALCRPSLLEVFETLDRAIDRFGHAATYPDKNRGLPKEDLREVVAAFTHVPSPTFIMERNILGRNTGFAIRKDKRVFAFFREASAPPPVSREGSE